MSGRYQYWLDSRYSVYAETGVRGHVHLPPILRWWEYREIWRKHVKMKHTDASVSFFWTLKYFLRNFSFNVIFHLL